MLKKYGSLLVVILLVLSLVVTGCGGPDEPAEPAEPTDTEEPVDTDEETEPSDDQLDIVLLINGTLGDRSFFDSAHNGMQLIEQELGANVRTIEMSYDQSSWEPTLWDVSEQDWDIIVLGTWQMQEYLEEIAPEFPDNRYIIFDTSVDYSLVDWTMFIPSSTNKTRCILSWCISSPCN